MSFFRFGLADLKAPMAWTGDKAATTRSTRRNGAIGMTFVDKSVFRQTPNFRARRRRTLVKVQFRNSRNELQDIMVQDISSAGMRATARIAPPDVDEVITVQLPDSNVLWGIVRWVEGNQFGVEFDVSSSPVDFAGDSDGTADSSQIDFKG